MCQFTNAFRLAFLIQHLQLRSAQGFCSSLHSHSLNYAILFNILMIFAECTDMNLNYLQTKGICILPKIMGYRTKVSFFIKQPNINEICTEYFKCFTIAKNIFEGIFNT